MSNLFIRFVREYIYQQTHCSWVSVNTAMELWHWLIFEAKGADSVTFENYENIDIYFFPMSDGFYEVHETHVIYGVSTIDRYDTNGQWVDKRVE